MSKLVGLGAGLMKTGDLFTHMTLARDRQQMENEAIQRALAQEERDNQFRQDQLALQQQQLDEQVANRRELVKSREVDDAIKLSQNFPGAPLSSEQGEEWLGDERAPLVVKVPGIDHSEAARLTRDPGAMGTNLGSVEFPSPNYGSAKGAVGTLMGASDPKKFEQGPTSYFTRQSESEKMRLEALRNANRMQLQTMKNAFLEKKLAQDKQLAADRLSLSREQLASIEARAEALIGYNYDALDQRTAIANADMESDYIIALIKAEAQKNRQNMFFNIPGLQVAPGGAGAATPPPAAPPPPRPTPIPPPNRGGGAPPPAGASGGLGAALENARRKKAGQQ